MNMAEIKLISLSNINQIGFLFLGGAVEKLDNLMTDMEKFR